MILNAILKFLKFVIEGAAKITAYILLKLGLWLPAIYSLAFLIICLINKIKIKGTVTVIFITGAVISYALVLGFRWLKFKKQHKKSEPEPVDSDLKKPEKTENKENIDYSEYEKKYLSEKNQGNFNYLNNGNNSDNIKQTEESPMIFATRKDPDVFVYEYSDRFEFYRKENNRFIYLSTEFKN